MGVREQAKQDLEKAYQESGVMIIKDGLDVITKYQEVDESGSIQEFGIDEMQNDAIRLTALCFTIHSLMVEFEATWAKAKAKTKFERAHQFNLLKQADIKKSDGRCENEAEEAIYQYVLEEINSKKAMQYLDIAWQRMVDMVNVLKKSVEKRMWQGQQPS